jgi:hypothetical protein
MPMVLSVHPISRGRSTTWRVETRELCPAFHLKTEPGAGGPSSLADLTSAFQVGHSSIAEITAQTVSGSAAMWISP